MPIFITTSYISFLCEKRNWLAGDHFSQTDITAAAHHRPWIILGMFHGSASGCREWYARVKSRPSFQGVLEERLPGHIPGQTLRQCWLNFIYGIGANFSLAFSQVQHYIIIDYWFCCENQGFDFGQHITKKFKIKEWRKEKVILFLAIQPTIWRKLCGHYLFQVKKNGLSAEMTWTKKTGSHEGAWLWKFYVFD